MSKKQKTVSVAERGQRPAFMLYCGQLSVVPMPYTYMRRAQATLHRMVWTQVALGDDLEALCQLSFDGVDWQIEDWGGYSGKIVRKWSGKYKPIRAK